MKSVGEIMALGRTFKEALQKGLRSLEMDTSAGEGHTRRGLAEMSDEELAQRFAWATPERIAALNEAISRGPDRGFSPEAISQRTGIDPWFVRQMAQIGEFERALRPLSLGEASRETLLSAKRMGLSDRRLASLLRSTEEAVRRKRRALGIQPVFHRIDTCAGEFQSFTPYLYSTYESHCEAEPENRRKVLILGGGPIRIGQGIEFDYCACHAAFALRHAGVESILLNCNPETVSTDYDTADRLYFEPVTLEDTLHVIEKERPEGVIVQFGGQTPLKLARSLEREGVAILGTSVDSIDLAEDRDRFGSLLAALQIPRPEMAIAASVEETVQKARRLGYPLIVRPSYVLGGRAMQVVFDDAALREYAGRALRLSPDHPLFLDRFLEDAFEVDVDALSDGRDVLVAGIQQHIEEAGIHSGDSACVLPPFKVPEHHQETMCRQTALLARAMKVIGLLNVQFAIKDDVVYVIEANPRASRTVPWLSKASGLPLVSLATRVILGEPLRTLVPEDRLEPLPEMELPEPSASPTASGADAAEATPTRGGAPFETHAAPSGGAAAGALPPSLMRRPRGKLPSAWLPPGRIFVKMPTFSSSRFPEVDTLLGPEMRSTGEVLGVGHTFGHAFAKAAAAAGIDLPHHGTAFLTLNDNDKSEALSIAEDLADLGFSLVATRGTAEYLRECGLQVESVYKVNEGHPHAADRIAAGSIQLVINTPLGRESFYDETAIRKAALAHGVPCITTLSGSRAVVDAIRTLRAGEWEVESVQELHHQLTPAPEPRRPVA